MAKNKKVRKQYDSRRTYKYRMYTGGDFKHIDSMLNEAAWVWNCALAIKKYVYNRWGKSVSIPRLKKFIAKKIRISKNNPDCKWTHRLHSQTIQEILERMDKAYKAFFEKTVKRPPKFKKARHMKSFLFKQGGFTIEGNVFTINDCKKTYKFAKSRDWQGNIKNVNVKRYTNGRYFLIIVTDGEHDKYHMSRSGAMVGIDFGLKTYLTLSDDSVRTAPLFFKQHESKIRIANRRLSRAKKKSNNSKRRQFELNQIHIDITNKRGDYQWKLAHELCRKYTHIFIETLNIAAMKRLWGKKISDLSHSSFILKLQHVAMKYGTIVHKIDKFYASSKTCTCGIKNDSLSLKDRSWTCVHCGATHERDKLAANNILRRGIYELESGCKPAPAAVSHACI